MFKLFRVFQVLVNVRNFQLTVKVSFFGRDSCQKKVNGSENVSDYTSAGFLNTNGFL